MELIADPWMPFLPGQAYNSGRGFIYLLVLAFLGRPCTSSSVFYTLWFPLFALLRLSKNVQEPEVWWNMRGCRQGFLGLQFATANIETLQYLTQAKQCGSLLTSLDFRCYVVVQPQIPKADLVTLPSAWGHLRRTSPKCLWDNLGLSSTPSPLPVLSSSPEGTSILCHSSVSSDIQASWHLQH